MHVLFNSTCTAGRRFVVFFVGTALGRNNRLIFVFFFVNHLRRANLELLKNAKWRLEGGECVWTCPSLLVCAQGVMAMLPRAHSSHTMPPPPRAIRAWFLAPSMSPTTLRGALDTAAAAADAPAAGIAAGIAANDTANAMRHR